MRAGRLDVRRVRAETVGQPRTTRSDDTDRPGPRDDFRRSVTPLYPAEGAHEMVRPNFQAILSTHSGFVKHSACRVCHGCRTSPCEYSRQPVTTRKVLAPGEIATTWKNTTPGPLRTPQLPCDWHRAGTQAEAPGETDDDGPQPGWVVAHRMKPTKRLGPLSDRARRPATRRRRDRSASRECAADWRPLPRRRPRPPRPRAARRPRPRPAPRAHRGR